MLIKRVYEIDPLACPNCGGTMKVVAFLEPPQADVIEKILRHCGLWHATRAPPAGEDLVHGPDGHSQAANDAPRELTFVAQDLTYVDEDTQLVRILIAPASPGGRRRRCARVAGFARHTRRITASACRLVAKSCLEMPRKTAGPSSRGRAASRAPPTAPP